MGGIVKGSIGGVGRGSSSNDHSHPLAAQVACLQAQVAHLTKLVHNLWSEAQQVAEVLHIDDQGLHITAGTANFKVLRSGVIVVDAPSVRGKGNMPMGNLPGTRT